jgi:hypothetical protein
MPVEPSGPLVDDSDDVHRATYQLWGNSILPNFNGSASVRGQIMKTKMPSLIVRNTYPIESEKISNYLDNIQGTRGHSGNYAEFVPTDFANNWGKRTKRINKIVLEYREEPFEILSQFIQKIHDAYSKIPEEWDKVIKIKDLLINGEEAWPLLILKGYEDRVHPERKIYEGQHRAVAHQLISSEILPLFVMRYKDDTDGELF